MLGVEMTIEYVLEGLILTIKNTCVIKSICVNPSDNQYRKIITSTNYVFPSWDMKASWFSLSNCFSFLTSEVKM